MVGEIFQGNCPYCGTRQVAFEILRFTPDDLRGLTMTIGGMNFPVPMDVDIFAKCAQCDRGVAGEARITLDRGASGIEILEPKVFSRPDIPTLRHIPPDVRDIFREGQESMWDKRYMAAGAMFRKALEAGMKIKFPELRGSLQRCIDQAKKDSLLTAEMAEWAHQIRSLGNEAAHEERFLEDDAKELHTFTLLVLLYLFTLPEMMKNAREKNKLDSENAETTTRAEE